ncbi:MAG: alpha/beta hydrolase fold domain-containing protein [Oscillospiraceae bacterium]|nr:alpha/beta hydrolase fold domain-containing protein [Oscillospiraceae bacterium]
MKLWPDKELRVRKCRIGRVPTLILRPANRSSVPVSVLWIHGGGFITGMKEMVYMSRAAELVRKYGVTVYAPGYRLAWLNPYPAALEDCYQVLESMSRQGDALMVGGESAGGGLAAAVCMMARDRGIRVAFQMPLYPMLSNLDTESSRDNHGRIWNTRRNHFGWRLYLRKDARKAVSPYAAPANQTDYRNLPPCYTFVGAGEPFYVETLAYVENLKRASVEARADVYPMDMHAFDLLRDDALSREAIQRFEAQFEKALEHLRKKSKMGPGPAES